MRLLIPALLLSLIAATATASEPSHAEQIAAIRALYAEVRALEQAEYDGRPTVTMVLEQVMPATGPQTVRLSYLLGERRTHDEQVYADLYVRKVSASWNFAARPFSAEYLFASAGEELVFHFSTDGQEEVRSYFHGGELVRLLRKRGPEVASAGATEQKDGGFTAEELTAAGRIQAYAASLLEAYRATRRAVDGQVGSR
jgi:hypothetical protein